MLRWQRSASRPGAAASEQLFVRFVNNILLVTCVKFMLSDFCLLLLPSQLQNLVNQLFVCFPFDTFHLFPSRCSIILSSYLIDFSFELSPFL